MKKAIYLIIALIGLSAPSCSASKLDFSPTDSGTGKELLKRYGSGAIPLYLVFDTQGALLGRIQGAAKPDKFMADLQTILDRQQPKQGK